MAGLCSPRSSSRKPMPAGESYSDVIIRPAKADGGAKRISNTHFDQGAPALRICRISNAIPSNRRRCKTFSSKNSPLASAISVSESGGDVRIPKVRA